MVDDEITALVRQAEAKAAELKDDSSPEDARRITREHDEIIAKIEAAKRGLPSPDAIAKLRDLAARGINIRDFADGLARQGFSSQFIEAEAARAGEMFRLSRGLKIADSFAGEHIRSGTSLDEFSRALINHMADLPANNVGPTGTSSVEVNPFEGRHNVMNHNSETLDNPQFLRTTIENALACRMSGKPAEGAAREFVGRSLRDLDAILAESRGERVSWLEKRDMGGMHTTSDFPNLLTAAGNRVLLDSYESAQSPLMSLARVRSAPDFRNIYALRIGEAPALEKVAEGGEIHYGTRAEVSETFKVETYARIFSLSRQAFVNDDLSAFGDFNAAFGRAAAECEANQIMALLALNSGNGPTMSDGKSLFHSDHGNLAGSGGAIDTDTLSAARLALRTLKGLDGTTPVNLVPRFLVVGPAKETEAEQVVATLAPAQVSNANPFSGKLEILVEPRISGNTWYVFAGRGEQNVLNVAYLDGQNRPSVSTRDGWTTLGMEFRAVLDFGCGIVDHRGAYKNPGA